MPQLLNDRPIGTGRYGLESLAGLGPPEADVFRRAQGNGRAIEQLQCEGVFQIARDARRVPLAESRQDVIHLGPLQIAQQPVRDAGFLDDFAARRIGRPLAPLQAPGDRLPVSRRSAALQQ